MRLHPMSLNVIMIDVIWTSLTPRVIDYIDEAVLIKRPRMEVQKRP